MFYALVILLHNGLMQSFQFPCYSELQGLHKKKIIVFFPCKHDYKIKKKTDKVAEMINSTTERRETECCSTISHALQTCENPAPPTHGQF